MTKKVFLGLMAIGLMASTANAALLGSFVSIDKDLAIASNAVFPSGGNVDTYEFQVVNSGDNATSVEASFGGQFYQIAGAGAAFRDSAGVPNFFGNVFPDSFFVLPGSANVLATGTMDTVSQLSSSFTLPGDTAIIPGSGQTTTIAFLTVPAGSAVPTFNGGRAAIAGAFESIELDTGVVDPILAGVPASGSSLSAALQAAFNARTSDTVIVPDAIMVMNDADGGTLADLGVLTEVVIDDNAVIDVGLTPGGDGKYNLVMSGPFSSLPRGTVIDGTIQITATGDPDGQLNYSFSVNVPEPSTVALLGIAAVGMAFGLRSRK